MSITAGRTIQVLFGVGIVVVAACGGKSPAAAPEDTSSSATASNASTDENPCTGGFCPPEKFDEIQVALARKRTAAARCLVDAVEAGEAPKGTKVRLALTFVIGRGGKARDITVAGTSFKNRMLEECVVAKIGQIDFGKLPNDLNWSYSYAFETN